jgi:hypothetical protein
MVLSLLLPFYQGVIINFQLNQGCLNSSYSTKETTLLPVHLLLLFILSTDNSKTNTSPTGSKPGTNASAEVSNQGFIFLLQNRNDEPSKNNWQPIGTTAADFISLKE